MKAALLAVGGVAGAAVTFSTVFVLMRILAWIVVEGIPSMISRRSRAVVEWQDCDQQGRRSEWDVHVDTALDVLLTHEATPDIDEFGEPARWQRLEEEFAELDPLAAQLGGAS